MRERRKKTSPDWDVIVIGAGVGGLALAAMLAKSKKQRVLVLEQHKKVGGLTHTFTRYAKYHFDTGVHYIGELQKGSDLRTLLDYLTEDKLNWRKLPHCYDKLYFANRNWEIPSSQEEHKHKLQSQFPEEKDAIEKYFSIEKQMAEAYGLWNYSEKHTTFMKKAIRWYLRIFRKEMFLTTGQYLENTFSNEALKQIISARWLGFGSPPDKSSFGMHCLHAQHYSEGAWYPSGGGQEISDQLVGTIKKYGGDVVTSSRVSRMILNQKKIAEVEINERERIKSRFFVSNVGAKQTYLKLLPNEVKIPFRRSLEEAPAGDSVISLFLTLKESPRNYGFDASNHWIFSEIPSEEFHELKIHPIYFLSFPSLKQESSYHTSQVILLCNSHFFEQWKGSQWYRRPQDYTDFKERLSDWIIEFIEEKFPGFSENIKTKELSTPLSVEHFTLSHKGAVYGIPSDPERLFVPWAQSKTPIKNLLMTGSDTFSPGISGSIHGGIKTFEILSTLL